MPTPKDNPSILREWKNLEEKYLRQGLSRWQTYRLISREYGTVDTNVYRWLTPKHREWTRKYYKQYYIEHIKKRENVRMLDFSDEKKYDTFYHKISRNLAYLLSPEKICRKRKSFSPNSLAKEIWKITGIRMKTDTIERILMNYKIKTNYSPLNSYIIRYSPKGKAYKRYVMNLTFYKKTKVKPINIQP